MDNQAPGFRFYPTEEELVSFYLNNKLEGTREDLDPVIPVVDIYKYSPWDLPRFAGELCQGNIDQWFFFVPRQEREAHGGRPNRLTTTGYWKASGSLGYVYSNNGIIGVKRTMVFYRGRVPDGRKTEWKMNEYRAIEGETSSSSNATPPKLRQEISLCRVYLKSTSLRTCNRPQPSEVVRSEETVHQPRPGNEATSHQHQQLTGIRISPPTHNASLGDGTIANNPCQVMENGSWDWDVSVDNDFLWDWVELNWF
ncbi:unnamed protein product [Ilex paraguariensis]|uniref:NAC domain-containing protein n=1 Tax=Ilex paraguariensis TaxID=185542 RepID=A0ABC8V2F4_9AQUA